MRFFFDLHNDIYSRDEEGVELANAGAARNRAVLEAQEMASASIRNHGRIDLRHFISTRDEAGIVGKLMFEDAVSFLRDGVKV